jgi:uncharacterized CHY-type Zn-finger protein
LKKGGESKLNKLLMICPVCKQNMRIKLKTNLPKKIKVICPSCEEEIITNVNQFNNTDVEDNNVNKLEQK